LADRLAVVPGFRQRQAIKILLHPVGDLVENDRAFRNAGTTPALLRGVRAIKGGFDILLVRTRNLAKQLAVHRRTIPEVLAGPRLGPFASNEVAVSFSKGTFVVRENASLFMAVILR